MLPSAFRRASRPLHKPVSAPDSTTQDIFHIVSRHNLQQTTHRQTPTLKRKIRSSEKNLQWWLENRDPTAIFRSDDSLAQRARAELLTRVRDVIQKKFGPKYWVDTFGSIKYGTASAQSDMDLIIFDQTRSRGFEPHKTAFPKIYNIKVLAGTLRNAGFSTVRPIPASVPIVKFKDPKTGIECDINVNDQPGYWNSIMLKRYTRLSPHLQGLLMAVKRWAKPLGLNAPGLTPATFSSYTFALMTVGFLQHRGLLPNLQENIGPDVKEHVFWNRKPVYLCDLRFNWDATPIPANREVSTTSLLMDWFKLWADFDASQQVVDICRGGLIPRMSSEQSPKGFEASAIAEQGSLKPADCTHERRYGLHDAEMLERWEFQAICVIDPFIRVRNITKNISVSVFGRFQEECRRAGADLRRRSPIKEDVTM